MSDCINRGCGGKKDGVCMNDFPGVKCYGYEPPRKTHADRIRQMSDEELAEWLDAVSKSWYDEGYTKDDESPLMSGYPATANEWISWLKSPVEEVQDGKG